MSHEIEIERIAVSSGKPLLELLEWFLERAAVREYCGGATREDAEVGAVRDLELAHGTCKLPVAL